MKIKLRKDWDYQPKLRNENGHHITRKNEHLVLIDFLIRRNEGSMIVCGNRGIGKTSSVINAVNDAIKKQQNKQLIPILIKATSIDFKHEHISYRNNGNNSSENSVDIIMDDEAKKPLLKSLIRFLHKEIQNDKDGKYKNDKNLKNKTRKLYEESLATEAYDVNKTVKNITKMQTFKGFFKLPMQFLIGLAGISIIFHDHKLVQDWWWLVILTITGLGIIGTMLWEYRIKSSEFTSSYNKHDHDFSYLLSNFEDLLTECSEKYKILFILDEFDKIEQEFKHAISHMKMLINQGNALFIFITSPDKIKKIYNQDDIEYTMFSQILFLNRPLFEEMHIFIDNIVQTPNNELNDLDYVHFKNYLCFESKTDFFSIYRVIRDHINLNNDGNPVIEFSFNDASLRRALIQEAITWIYNRKERSKLSEKPNNEKILDALYNVAYTLETYPRPEEIIIEGSMINFVPPRDKYEIIDVHFAVADLCEMLKKNGYLKLINKNHYKIIGGLVKINPSGVFVTEHKTFIRIFEEFEKQMITFANIRSKWSDKQEEPFDVDTIKSKLGSIMPHLYNIFDSAVFTNAELTYEQLRNNDVVLVSQDILDKQNHDIDAASKSIKKQSIHLLVEILQTRIKASCIVLEDLTDNFFTSLEIEKQKIPNAVLHYRKGAIFGDIVILYAPDLDFIDHLRKKIKSNCLIICLIGSEYFSNYGSRSFMYDNLNSLKGEIENFKFLHYQRALKQMPIDDTPDPYAEKTFFYKIQIPLESHIIEQFLDVVEVYKKVE